jgi:hypothetical protein
MGRGCASPDEGIGSGAHSGFLRGGFHHFCLALGLVFASAVLGGLAFGTAPDVTLLWHDEQGHFSVGIKRSETQRLLDDAQQELTEVRRSALDTMHRYGARVDVPVYLRPRTRPGQTARMLIEIPANAAGIFSPCKLAVAHDKVLVEVYYQDLKGWVDAWALMRTR